MQMHVLVCVPAGRQNDQKVLALASSFQRKMQMGMIVALPLSTRLNAIKLKYFITLTYCIFCCYILRLTEV